MKRRAFEDLTNVSSDEDIPLKTEKVNNVLDLMPCLDDKENTKPVELDVSRFQNVHPMLSWYKHDLETGVLSYDNFMALMNPDNDVQLINVLTQIGVIAETNTCLLCGGSMRKKKDGEHWFWVCMRRVNGVKCNKGKNSVRTGTMGTVNFVLKKYCSSCGILFIICLKPNVSNIRISVRKIIQPLLSGIDFVEKYAPSGSGRKKIHPN